MLPQPAMPATLDLYINLSAPARRALVQSYASLSNASAPDFVVRDTVRLRLHFMTVASGARVGTTFDLGGTATINFGAKPTATFASATSYLFYSSSFTRDASDPADVVFEADVDLNTSELVTALGSAATLGVKFEVEVDDGATLQTVAQADANAVNDVIDGTSSSPTSSTPAYPAAPAADSFLTGNAAGTAWQQRNAAAARTLLGLGTGSAVTFGSLTTTSFVRPASVQVKNSLNSSEFFSIMNTDGDVQFWTQFEESSFQIRLPTTGSEADATLRFNSITANRNYDFPDASGTVATFTSVPANASATGSAGQMAYDSSYLYICTATNTWRRIAHSTW